MTKNSEQLRSALALSAICLIGMTACEKSDDVSRPSDSAHPSPSSTVTTTPEKPSISGNGDQDLHTEPGGGIEVHFTTQNNIGRLVFKWGYLNEGKESTYDNIVCLGNDTMRAVASNNMTNERLTMTIDEDYPGYLYDPISKFCENQTLRQLTADDAHDLATTLNNVAVTLEQSSPTTGLKA